VMWERRGWSKDQDGSEVSSRDTIIPCHCCYE